MKLCAVQTKTGGDPHYSGEMVCLSLSVFGHTFLSGGRDLMNSNIIAWASFFTRGGISPFTITLRSWYFLWIGETHTNIYNLFLNKSNIEDPLQNICRERQDERNKRNNGISYSPTLFLCFWLKFLIKPVSVSITYLDRMSSMSIS